MRKLFSQTGPPSISGLFKICLAIFFATCSLVQAQEPSGRYHGSEILTSESAPVIVDGKELFRVGGVSSYPAKERAGVIAKRIKELAQDKTFDPKSLQIVREGDVTFVKAGDRIVTGLVESDAVREGLSVELLAELIQAKIVHAIIEYRNDRAPRVLLINSGYALIATVLTAFLLWGILRAFVWLDGLAERKIMARVERLQSKSHYIIDAGQVRDMLRGLLKTFNVLVILVVIYLYLNLVLGLYPWTRLFAKYLFTITIDPLRVIGLGFINALPKIFFLVIFFFVFRYILKATGCFLSASTGAELKLKTLNGNGDCRPTR